MARIRTIKPEFWTSEQIAELSPIARLLFIGMWNFCDDFGIHPASAKSLKMQVFPGDDITAAQITGMIAEMVKQGLVIEYQVDSKDYWQVTGWHHQKIDRPNSKYPLPFVERSTNDLLQLDEQTPPEGKGVEKEGKGRETDSHSNAQFSPENEIENKPAASEKSDFDAAYEAILEFVKPNDFVQLRVMTDRAMFNSEKHGTTAGAEVKKFVSHYLGTDKAESLKRDPVKFFRNLFPGWLERAKTIFSNSAKPAPEKQKPDKPEIVFSEQEAFAIAYGVCGGLAESFGKKIFRLQIAKDKDAARDEANKIRKELESSNRAATQRTGPVQLGALT